MYPKRKARIKMAVVAAGVLFSGMSHAQSSITLFGMVDGGLLYTSKTLDPTTGRNAGKQFSFTDSGISPSQFGLMGQEDLGGGLKAEFRLESGISVATGGYSDSNGNQFGRQAYVGLKGRLGEVKAGLQFSPFFLSLYELDPRGLSQFGSSLPIYLGNVSATGVFTANAVSYTSPIVAGFQGGVLLAMGGKAGDFQAGRQYSANLKYDDGTLMVNAAFFDGNGGGTVNTNPPSTVAFEGRMLGASYKIGKLTTKLSFVNFKIASRFNNNVYGGGLDYFALPQLDLNGGVWYITDRDKSSNHSLMAALGVQYFLSRATTLYAQFGVLNNHGEMSTGLSVSNALFGATGTTTGANIGIRHMF
ncbi:porin [Burkholderia sp. Bp9017]|uniref:porin n=1 Tax=Burkholderia TaxID=32008 RepID=UPI000F5ED9B1|nr:MULTISPECIES: porin [Burkholderia]RQZ31719.1 porin [Burkholderia sp. Bp9017]RQZ37850.1 porin [Burkholderia sp. Bp9016]